MADPEEAEKPRARRPPDQICLYGFCEKGPHLSTQFAPTPKKHGSGCIQISRESDTRRSGLRVTKVERWPRECLRNLFVPNKILPACHHAVLANTRSMKTMKKVIWLLPLLIILGTLFVAVEMKGSSPSDEITISYGNLIDTRGRSHSVELVLHPNGSVTWRDLTHHIR